MTMGLGGLAQEALAAAVANPAASGPAPDASHGNRGYTDD